MSDDLTAAIEQGTRRALEAAIFGEWRDRGLSGNAAGLAAERLTAEISSSSAASGMISGAVGSRGADGLCGVPPDPGDVLQGGMASPSRQCRKCRKCRKCRILPIPAIARAHTHV